MSQIKPTLWDFLDWEVLGDKIMILAPIVVAVYFPLFFYRLFFEGLAFLKSIIFGPKFEKEL
jgi:hypothetical protein